MSRTDVHTPAWVKERDPAWRRNYSESHNHSWHVIGHEKHTDEDGHTAYRPIWKKVEQCDLDVYLASSGWVRTACRIDYVHTGRNIHCGCNLCTGQFYRHLDNRTDRQRTKRLLRAGRWDEIRNKSRCRY